MACADAIDPQALAGHPVYGGLDLSITTDMSALVLYWPHTGAVLPYFWLPEEGLLDRDRKEQGHYRTWLDRGLLETTPGKAINFAQSSGGWLRLIRSTPWSASLMTVPLSRRSRRNVTRKASSCRWRNSAKATSVCHPPCRRLRRRSSIDEFAVAGAQFCAGK